MKYNFSVFISSDIFQINDGWDVVVLKIEVLSGKPDKLLIFRKTVVMYNCYS